MYQYQELTPLLFVTPLPFLKTYLELVTWLVIKDGNTD
jgi:hypothetical protein